MNYWEKVSDWREERTSKLSNLYQAYRFYFLAFLLGLLPTLFVYGYYYYKKSPPLVSEIKEDTSLYGQLTGLPQTDPSQMTLPELRLENSGLVPEEPEVEEWERSGLKVLSGKILPIFQKNDPLTDGSASPSASQEEEFSIVGIRIVGEMKNIGKEVISGAKAIIKFYDDDEKLLATKIGNWTEGYEFLSLGPEEINVYDLLVPNPPEAKWISIQLKEDRSEGISRSRILPELKVKEKSLEETSLEQDEEVLFYYKFKAILVNTEEGEIINPKVYLWLKDAEGKVIGVAYKNFEADLVTQDQELEANLLLVPFTSEEELFSYEVKVFGEKL